MRRFTISLADRMHRALKEATGRQNRSMGSIVENSLELRGIRLCGTTEDIVAEARAKAALNADDAMALAVEETRDYRLVRLPWFDVCDHRPEACGRS